MKKVNLILGAVVMAAMMLSSCGSVGSNEVTIDEVTIGTQVWMSNNLDVSTFRNGDPIPEAKTAREWQEAEVNRQPAWSYYNNDPAYGARYGKLYNWYAVNDSRGLAPEGWHIPTDAEWSTLENYLGNDAGNKLKSTSGWINYGNGTNSSGFSGLPGGYRSDDGTFDYNGFIGSWWSSTERNTDRAISRQLDKGSGYVYSGNYVKKFGLSVRCLRD